MQIPLSTTMILVMTALRIGIHLDPTQPFQ